MKAISDFLKVISDPNRLLIVYLLKEQTLCVCDIQTVIPLTQGALSIQLKNLAKSGLLDSSKRGKWVFYKFANEMPVTYINILSELFIQMDKDKDVQSKVKLLTITGSCKA